MDRTVVAALDGSPESRAAAEWAAREAKLRGLPLKIVHVWEPVPEPMAQAPMLGAETQAHWTERIPRETAEGLRLRHPGVEVTAEQLNGRPAEVLPKAAEDAELLVLGSRGMSGIGGFLVGSVGQSVIAHTEVPVVLVRAGEQAADEHETDPAGIPSAGTAFRPVVLGFDTDSPDDAVTAFAFEEAARRNTALRVVHAWNLPPYYVYGLSADAGFHDEVIREKTDQLTEALRRWRKEYPSVEVVEVSRPGSAAQQLVDASRGASLVVVGRKIRRGWLGTHIGSVAHAVLHHATAPVAVVAHG
ncbi:MULTISPECIES: universal stress protein [unclassified Streptomyces]|uniref:universal stress protein n=1 Tax=unclassified Streptomyces TaxID=2593676 RepID=UPI001F045B36|nr:MULTISPECIES: universal stress protein [unclassified Streptomyces]MCH0565790.1 universal stress protein [Streptomyces sp. MUM 2J]MCH0571045.1 universal stress protein [Streptomyces sp. MUM 136J]